MDSGESEPRIRRSPRLQNKLSVGTIDRNELKKKKESKKKTSISRKSKSFIDSQHTSNLDIQDSTSAKETECVKPDKEIIETSTKRTLKRRQNILKEKSKDSSKLKCAIENEPLICETPTTSKDQLEVIQEPSTTSITNVCEEEQLLDFLLNEPEKSINDFDTKTNEESIFDKTMYNMEGTVYEEDIIPDNRDWNKDLAPDFNVCTQLERKPGKSCLKRQPKLIMTNPVRTYKYYDKASNRMVYVVGGFSNSTYIRRIIIYLQAIKTSFEMILIRSIVPGVNLEAYFYGSLQSFLELFQDDVIPMLSYSIFNKDLTPYFHQLMLQFQDTIHFFLLPSVDDSKYYQFNVTKKVLAIHENEEDQFLNRIEKTVLSIFCENIYLFKSVLLYQVFNRQAHFSVLREMFNIFKAAMLAAAESSMTVE